MIGGEGGVLRGLGWKGERGQLGWVGSVVRGGRPLLPWWGLPGKRWQWSIS